jgi:hypothetical protein
MTKDDIIKLAREAGAAYDEGLTYFEESDLHRFANLVAEREREECAKVCEQWDASHPDVLADAIRARGNT